MHTCMHDWSCNLHFPQYKRLRQCIEQNIECHQWTSFPHSNSLTMHSINHSMHTQISPSKINLNPLSCKITGKSLIIQCTLKNGTCMENKWIKCKVDTRGRWFLHWIHTEYMNWANSITFTLKRNLIRLTIIDFVYVSRTLSLHFYCTSLVLNITDINVEHILP